MAAGKKGKGKKRKGGFFTPQAIAEYYREHQRLPPEMEKRGTKKR